MNERVMTVLGPVPAVDLGLVDAHSHVWIEQVPGANLEGLILDDEQALAAELVDFRAAGGGAIVDCQPGGVGRNGNKLRSISRTSGVHIVASTGFHLRRYYAAEAPIWSKSAEEAAAHFVGESKSGLLETRETAVPVYPGVIKIAAEATLAESPLALFEAAAAAAHATGLAIEMHTEQGAAVELFLAFFLARGLPAARLVFCHMDKRPDFGLHRELAQAGVLLEYDTFVRPKYRPEENAWPLLIRMIDAGLAGSVSLATDSALTSMWTYLGGSPGAAAFLTQIKARLDETAVPTEDKNRLLGGNIAARLAFTQPLQGEA
jgi:phosphotriesterase-related protein